MKKEIPAMMTLEAVIILPLCLAASILILWCGMLLYNRSTAAYAVSVVTIQTARNAEAENAELVAFAEEKAAELLQGRFVMMDSPEFTVKVDGMNVTAQIAGRMKAPPLPLPGSTELSFDWSVASTRSSPRLKSSMIVRSLHAVSQ